MPSPFRMLLEKVMGPVKAVKSIYNANAASLYLLLGKSEKALSLTDPAQNTFLRGTVWKGTSARLYNNAAKAHFLLGHYQKAIDQFESARKIYQGKNKDLNIALCEVNIAQAHFELGHYKEALDLYVSAREIFERKGHKDYTANIDKEMAAVYSRLGRIEEAVRLNRSAREALSRKAAWQAETAHCDIELARIYSGNGENEKAVEWYLSARSIFEESDMYYDIAKCDVNVALEYLALGQNELALESLQSARKLFTRLKKRLETAECDHNLAKVHFQFSEYDKALELLHSSRQVFIEDALPEKAAVSDMEIARIHAQLGNYEKALELNRSAREVLENSKSKDFMRDAVSADILSCDFNIANIHYRLGEYEKALERYDAIRVDLEERGLKDETLNCDLNRACVYLFLNQHQQALELLQSVRKAYEEKGLSTDVAVCDLNMAAVHMLSREYKKALTIFKKVSASDDPNLKAKALFGIGNIHWRQKNIELAKSYCALAIEEIETMRESTLQDDLRTSFLGTVFDFYYLLVEICLENNDFKTAFEYVELLKSRSLAEMLVNRDLLPRNATEDERLKYKELRSRIRNCSSRLSAAKHPIRKLALSEQMTRLEQEYNKIVALLKQKDSSFDPDHKARFSHAEIKNLAADFETAIVELFPMDDKLAVFIIRDDHEIDECSMTIDGFDRFRLDDMVKGLLERYEAYKESSGPSKSKAKQAWEAYLEQILEEIHSEVFSRIRPRLSNTNSLTFIPYGGFHFLPLHAMFSQNGGSRHYVIDDYLVTYAPSAKVLKICAERSRPNRDAVVLAHADPKMNESPLRFAQNEMNAIRGLFPKSIVIEGATKSDIIYGGMTANIFHYTGHAHRRALILQDEDNPEKKKEYLLEDIFESLSLPEAYLVTLSACETGMITPKGVDEHFGISSGLLNAGAPTVISSLWSVSDISTSLLMRKMYELISTGKGKAESLREAQLWLKDPDKSGEHAEMFENIQNQYNLVDQQRGFVVSWDDWEEFLPNDLYSPFHWAAFVCTGGM